MIWPLHESTTSTFDCYRLGVTCTIDYLRHGDSCMIKHSTDKGIVGQCKPSSDPQQTIGSFTAEENEASSLKVALPCFHLHDSQPPSFITTSDKPHAPSRAKRRAALS